MCANEKFHMNQTQARMFAKAIFADIEDYVEKHKKEYENFLREEQQFEDEEKIHKKKQKIS